MDWLKDDLLEYALQLDLPVDGSMTKQQIFDAILEHHSSE